MHAPVGGEMAADRAPYRAQVCHRPRNNSRMAASSAQDRNLPASARKLEKARADGQVVRSRDLAHFAAIAGGGAAMAALAVAAALAAGGWTWTMKPLAPQFSALDPLAGLGRVFSRKQVVDAAKASVLALVLGTIGGLWLAGHVRDLVGVHALPLPAAIGDASAT